MSSQYMKILLILSIFVLIFLLHMLGIISESNNFVLQWTSATSHPMLSQMLETNYSVKFNSSAKSDKIVYVLEWTSPKTEPFIFLGQGQENFVTRHCKYTNCFVTSNKEHLKHISDFDVILFHGPEVRNIPNSNLPRIRSPHQKYVYVSLESSHYYPICSNRLDGFFNWTWTFRLDSDCLWGYLTILDASNNIIGPNKIMHWMKIEDMQPVSREFKEKLKTKSKAAAWFVSNCGDKSERLTFAKSLKTEMRKHNLILDIYGGCGELKCSKDSYDDEKSCQQLIDESYYFYLSFENSFSEDYVTEKLLRALQNNAIPVVYGGANYTRFMPDGIYLNARELGVVKLAAKMNELINNPDQYAEYFKWHNHYSYLSREESPEHIDYCRFCAFANDHNQMNKVTIVQKFREWWDNPKFC